MTVATFRGSSGAELYFTLPLPREFAAQVDRGELVPLDGPEPEPASPAELYAGTGEPNDDVSAGNSCASSSGLSMITLLW